MHIWSIHDWCHTIVSQSESHGRDSHHCPMISVIELPYNQCYKIRVLWLPYSPQPVSYDCPNIHDQYPIIVLQSTVSALWSSCNPQLSHNWWPVIVPLFLRNWGPIIFTQLGSHNCYTISVTWLSHDQCHTIGVTQLMSHNHHLIGVTQCNKRLIPIEHSLPGAKDIRSLAIWRARQDIPLPW